MGNGASVKSEEPKSSNKNIDDSKASFVQAPVLDEPIDSGSDGKNSKQLKKLALGQVGYKDTHREYDAALKALTTDKNADSKQAKPQFTAQDVSKIKNAGNGPQITRPPPPRQPPPTVTIPANNRKSNSRHATQPKPTTAPNAGGTGSNIVIAPSSMSPLIPPMQGPPPGYGTPQQQGTPGGNPHRAATATQFGQPAARSKPNFPPVRKQPSIRSKLSDTQKKYTQMADDSDDSDDEEHNSSNREEELYDWIDGTEQPPAGVFAIGGRKSNASDAARRPSDPSKVVMPSVSSLKGNSSDIRRPTPPNAQPDSDFLLANFAPDFEEMKESPVYPRPSKVPLLNIPVSSSVVNGPMYKTVDVGSTSMDPTPTHSKGPTPSHSRGPTPSHGQGTAKPPPPKAGPPQSPMRNIIATGPGTNESHNAIYMSSLNNSPMPGQRTPSGGILTGPKPSSSSPQQVPQSSHSRGGNSGNCNNILASSVESTVSNVGNVMRGSVNGPSALLGANVNSSVESVNFNPMGTNASVSTAGPYTTGRTMGVRATPPPKPTKSLMPHAVKETTDVKRNKIQLPTNMQHAKPTAGDWLKKRYIVNNYILLDTLGTGSYGEVRLCKDRVTENLYAIKIISRDLLKKKKHGHNSETFFEDIRREIAIMKKLLHPNVLRLYEVLDDSNVNKMYLVVEYMKNGDLINLLERDRGDGSDEKSKKGKTMTPLPEGEVWNIFRQVAAGIRYLHYQNVVHGDIKPQNLLVSESGIIKIADFGISKMLNDNAEKMTDGAGTPAFMSPELIAGQAFSGQLADVWALGATMYMLVYGHPPWVASNILNLYNKIQQEELVFPETPSIDPGLRDLLTKMMTKDPNDRITIQQVLQHPWFRQPPPPQKFKNANVTKRPSGTPSEAPSSGHGSRLAASRGMSFMPPKSYDKEEAAAMEAPLVKTNESDMFMSIGTRYDDGKNSTEAASCDKKLKSTKEDDAEDFEDVFATCVDDEEEGDEDEEDDDPKPMRKVSEGGESKSDGEDDGVNVMNTNWGDDVFEMVDDGDHDSDEDDDDDAMPPPTVSTGEKDAAMCTNSSSTNSLTHHTEMSAEELERRQMKFKKKNKQKSAASLVALGTGPKPIDLSTHNLAALSDKPIDKKNSLPPSIAQAMQKRNSPPSGFLSTDSTPKKLNSNKRIGRETPKKSEDDDEDSEDDVEAMDDDQFSFMMDTLARQPKDEEAVAELPVVHVNFNKVRVKASQTNGHNDVKIASHSEQGMRTSQEDRCIVVPNVAKLPIFNSNDVGCIAVENDVKEILHQFSIVCVFDGHSGHHVSQYLFDNFVNKLVQNYSRFVGKNLQALMTDCCESIDNAICAALRTDEDSAGSTGVMAVYDGRKHILTVANVGDSTCILCRKDGKAFRVLKMHRCADNDERTRILKCNAKVMNNR